MNSLDSSLEALAFNPVNLSLLFTNLWALLFAIIVAIVISLRHFRGNLALKMPHKTVSVQPVDEKVLPRATAVKTNDRDNANEELVRDNGKKCFTVYYEEGCCEVDDVDIGDYEEEESEMVIEKWTVEMRGGGELGWYDFQDRNVIDGSVVRLWESGSDSPRRCRSRRNSPTYYGFSSVYCARVDHVLGGFE